MTPFFSLIIPVYNTEKYIHQCIQSCIAQTYHDIEIIVIDDCGQDNSMTIAYAFLKQDSRIKIFHNSQNMGLLKTREHGVKRAMGMYCLFVDSDDYIANDTCQILYQQIKKNNSPDLIHFKMKHCPTSLLRINPRVHSGILSGKKMMNFLCINNSFQSLCDKAIKKEFLIRSYDKIGEIAKSINLMEDGLIVLCLAIQIHNYLGIQNTFYFYRNNQNSMTRTKTKKNFYLQLKDFKKIFKTLDFLYHSTREQIILGYKRKILSSAILNSRFYSPKELLLTLKLFARKSIQKSNCIYIPTYLYANILSFRYFYRWQTLARICIYIMTLGKIKL